MNASAWEAINQTWMNDLRKERPTTTSRECLAPLVRSRCQECFWGHFGALVLWRFGAPHQLVGAWCCWCRGLLVQIRRTLLVPTWLIVTKSRHRRRPLSTCWILSNAHVAKIRTGNGGRFVFCAVEMVVVILDLRLCVWFKRIGGRNIAKEIQTEIQRYIHKILLWRMWNQLYVCVCGQKWGGQGIAEVRPSRSISCQKKKWVILLLYSYFSLSVFVSVFSEKVWESTA